MSSTKPKVVVISDLSKFDINGIVITDPILNKDKRLVSYVNYVDPVTGEKGTPQFVVPGKYRIVFNVDEYKGKWYMQVDSEVNSMYPEKSTADADHQLFFNVLKSIDDKIQKSARANPGAFLGDENPSEADFDKKQYSPIKPSSKKNGTSQVKTPDGAYADSLKFSLPVKKQTKEHFCRFFKVPSGMENKFSASKPEFHGTVDDLRAGAYCQLVVESGGVWPGTTGYGHTAKAKVVKVFEGSNMSDEALANLLPGGGNVEEEEEEEAPVDDDAVEALGGGNSEEGSDQGEDDEGGEEEEEEEEELDEAPAPRARGRPRK